MLVQDFSNNYHEYEEFAVWDVENMDAFLSGNQVLTTILMNEYKMAPEEFSDRRSEIDLTDMQIMMRMLDQIGDKHFYIFTLHDENHLELIKMQRLNVMNFGVDIENISESHVYIMMMTKKTPANPSLN